MVIPLGDRFTQSVHLVIKKDGKLIKTELKPTTVRPHDRPRPARGRRYQGRQGRCAEEIIRLLAQHHQESRQALNLLGCWAAAHTNPKRERGGPCLRRVPPAEGQVRASHRT